MNNYQRLAVLLILLTLCLAPGLALLQSFGQGANGRPAPGFYVLVAAACALSFILAIIGAFQKRSQPPHFPGSQAGAPDSSIDWDDDDASDDLQGWEERQWWDERQREKEEKEKARADQEYWDWHDRQEQEKKRLDQEWWDEQQAEKKRSQQEDE